MGFSSRDDSFAYYARAKPQRQWGPLLAAFPHLWLGTTIVIALLDGKVLLGLPYQMLLMISDISLVLFLAVGLIIAGFAARNDQPLWAASWNGYTILAMAAVPGRMITVQNEENVVYQLGLLLLAALVVLIAYFVRFRRSPLRSLLMILSFLLVGPLFFLDSIPYAVEALFVVFLALLAAAVSAAVVITQQWLTGTAITLGAGLLAGMLYAWISTYYLETPALVSGGLLQSAGTVVASSFLAIIILIGPWLFWSAVGSGRQKQE